MESKVKVLLYEFILMISFKYYKVVKKLSNWDLI